MVVVAKTKTPAHEAQQFFFEIGMQTRQLVVASLSELGLTFPLAHALRLLEPGHPRPMSELAELLVCDASNVTALADRLESKGLAERQPHPGDRRVKALALTEDGIELRERVLELMSEPPPPIAALSVSDQRALRDILRRAVEIQRG
ncbi:MAG TPA: MarR family transcriptional regulator [Gaiellaceae bacterium]|jgi:DNA-binding MarR family transcriptional regulator